MVCEYATRTGIPSRLSTIEPAYSRLHGLTSLLCKHRDSDRSCATASASQRLWKVLLIKTVAGVFSTGMRETTTRRRVLQGAGVIGLASVAGSSMVVAQEEGSGSGNQEMQAALRVAHLSPDAPNVNVRLFSSQNQEEPDAQISGVSFGEVTDYEDLHCGRVR